MPYCDFGTRCGDCTFHEEFWEEMHNEQVFDGCLCNHGDNKYHTEETCPYFIKTVHYKCYKTEEDLCVLNELGGH